MSPCPGPLQKLLKAHVRRPQETAGPLAAQFEPHGAIYLASSLLGGLGNYQQLKEAAQAKKAEATEAKP
jgi:hypothetical protein